MTKESMDDFYNEIKRDFLTEAKELLSGTEKCFLDLEKSPNDLDNINNLFRLAHNLKGSSGAVGFTDLADFTHKLESLLMSLKDKKLQVTAVIVDLLLRCNDYLTTTIEALQGNLDAQYKNPTLAAELVNAMDPSFSGQGPASDSKVAAVPTEEAAREEALPEAAPDMVFAAAESPVAAAQASAKGRDENVRVSLAKIDQLLNNVGELVIFQAVMNQQSMEGSVTIPPLMRKTLSAMAKIVKETQEISMGLRMLPIKQNFQKMQRIVRDTSKALGKEVELHLAGEDTEVDKTVLEQIGDPLVHIIRNAVDHGLEDTDGRIKAGKSPVGNVHLSAFHRAGQVVIEVRDDGKGLDANKLTTIAKSKGVIPQDATPTQEQAYQLIFAAGFSTKSEVTDVSGRGVGMDVVKTNIAQLQGQIEIETTLGQGTCFRISLPLTLGIVDGIVVRLKDERFVVPLSQVSEFFRPKENEINFVHERAELLNLRKETLPVFRLSGLLQKEMKTPESAWNLTALIARDSQGKGFAIMVDEVLVQQQIVIKPLGAELKGKIGLMGSAILGDGKPALILDLHELKKQMGPSARIDTNKIKNEKMEAA